MKFEPSKLSKIIKSMWKLQKKDNFGEHVEYIGKWPIEFSKIQEVMNYLLESELNDLGDCAAIPAWNELMHQELIKLNLDENEEMLEFPADETWEYPHNTNWLAYWLLVNIKEK